MKRYKVTLFGLSTFILSFATNISISSGQLEGMIPSLDGVTELKLSGAINASDLAAIEKLPASVTTLDLSEVRIEGLSSSGKKYFGRTLFSEGEIPAYTFFKTNIKTLILPADVSKICEGAFAASALESLSVPDGVTALGDYALYGCANLKSVSLPASISTLGKGSLGNCVDLQSIDLSKTGVTELPERVFAGSSSLKTVVLPANLTKVGREAFAETAITTLDLSKVSEFDDYALSGMPKLTRLTINPDATIADGLLMDDAALYHLSGAPDNVPDYFAANCSNLEAESTMSYVRTVGKYSFANTASDTTLLLPSGLTKIERGAFKGIPELEKIDVTELNASIPEVDEYSFEGLNQPEIVLFVTDASYNDWLDAPYWNLFKIRSISNTAVTEINQDADNEINVRNLGSTIIVTSPADLADVRIYSADGRLVFMAAPGAPELEISTDSFPSGILILKAADDEGHTRSVSLLTK